MTSYSTSAQPFFAGAGASRRAAKTVPRLFARSLRQTKRLAKQASAPAAQIRRASLRALVFDMPFLIILVLIALGLGVYVIGTTLPKLGRRPSDWGTAAADDPRMAVAAMMVIVAREDGPVTREQEELMLSLLRSKVGFDAEGARVCLLGGKRMARMVRGDLNSRLHQFLDPIHRRCGAKERQDVLDMLYAVAGRRAERLGPVRDSLGRLSASLLQD
jgi:uncharacterized tellurite resistance protein B-like protein